MNKSDLIKLLKNEYNFLNLEQITLLVDEIFNELIYSLKNEQRIEIRGFGSFSTRARKVQSEFYKSGNENITYKEKKTAHFKIGSDFFKKINS